ncbi:hypothetical protein BG004_000892, partial [Podila humilis]
MNEGEEDSISRTVGSADRAALPSKAPSEEGIVKESVRHRFIRPFLATREARYILNLPSFLGLDPSDMSSILPMTEYNHDQSRLKFANSEETQRSRLLSELDAKADATAEALTEQHSVKNLDMTETEAHRMVQVMASEIVALHNEREQMQARLQQAKEEMLKAAQLLRMQATVIESGMLDLSVEGRKTRSGLSQRWQLLDQNDEEDEDEEDQQREAQRNIYGKDER